MILDMYSIHDIKSGVYLPPLYYQNEACALRGIRSDIKKSNNMISEYPTDYRVYKIARYDDSKGIVLPQTNPSMIMEVKDLLEGKKDGTT